MTDKTKPLSELIKELEEAGHKDALDKAREEMKPFFDFLKKPQGPEFDKIPENASSIVDETIYGKQK